MTRKQLEQAAQIDVRYFLMLYEACPTCKRRFDQMHPMENAIPHFYGTCIYPPPCDVEIKRPSLSQSIRQTVLRFGRRLLRRRQGLPGVVL